MLLDEGNQKEMIIEAKRKNFGLDREAVEFQRDVLENNFFIEKVRKSATFIYLNFTFTIACNVAELWLQILVHDER